MGSSTSLNLDHRAIFVRHAKRDVYTVMHLSGVTLASFRNLPIIL